MIKFLVIPVAIMLSCGSTKKNQSATTVDSPVVTEKKVIEKEPGDLNQRDSVIVSNEAEAAAVPKCIKAKIDSFRLKEAHERPQSVKEYTYKGRKVYYVQMPCCDFFNEVYDANCNYLGAPDGGFTGKGDGKIPDFAAEAKNEKLIWKAAK